MLLFSWLLGLNIPYSSHHIDTLLWSASLDNTIRVWDLNAFQAHGILNGPNGHTDAVTCMVASPAPDASIFSGARNGELKKWTGGNQTGQGNHNSGITTLSIFHREDGKYASSRSTNMCALYLTDFLYRISILVNWTRRRINCGKNN